MKPHMLTVELVCRMNRFVCPFYQFDEYANPNRATGIVFVGA